MPIRLTRVEQVERNRGQLLTAARRAFLERGYAGATLDAIADEAGFTKGVVYSHFAGKSDLFLALLERRIAERADENDRVVAEQADGSGGLGGLLRVNARHATEGADWARLLIEFRVVAARDPDLNSRYAALHARSLDRMTTALGRALDRAGLAPLIALPTMVRLIFALDSGAVLEQATDASALPLEFLEDLIARLVTPR